MDLPDADFQQAPDRWRQYLAALAEIQLAPRLRGKVDLSGVVQQTLLDAFRRGRPVAGGPAGEAAWLRQVLAHNLADEARKLAAGKRDVRREVSLEAELEASSVRLANLLAADQSSPGQRVVREEDAFRLAAALAQVPEAQREALVLQHWHGWPLARIAEHQGRTKAAVAGLIKRGLARLREVLSPE